MLNRIINSKRSNTIHDLDHLLPAVTTQLSSEYLLFAPGLLELSNMNRELSLIRAVPAQMHVGACLGEK